MKTSLQSMEASKHNILIIDDDRAVCASISLMLKKQGYQTDSIFSPKEAIAKAEEFRPDLILLDMNFTVNTSGKQGLSLLKQLKASFPETSVILMTGWATVQLAVEGMKLGARDFIAKPWENKQLLAAVHSVLHLFHPKAAVLSDDIADKADMIGSHPAFLKVKQMALQVARTDASVLIMGESGTGKEILAEAIHNASSRKQMPFVKVNMGGISSSLFESEMFGHIKGSFTDAINDREGRFSMADKGSIFLDEIGELPLQNQVKLLRVLQERAFEILGSSSTQHVDFRLISATNKNLSEMVRQGSFREDLFYRINLIILQLPSLKERRSDIPLLAQSFATKLCKLYQQERPHFAQSTLDWLSEQDYPGNIRALKNHVERTILLNLGKEEINIKHFQDARQISSNATELIEIPEVGSITLEALEASMIRKTLNYHRHSISKAARALGISRSALYRRLEKYKIPHEPSL